MRIKITEQIPPKALEVVMKVSEIYNIPVHEIMCKRRIGRMIIARHVAMHRLYNMQPSEKLKHGTLVRIGRWFDRDHSSVHNALKKVNKYLKIYEDYAITYNTLVRATANINLFHPVPLTLGERIDRLPKEDYDAIVSFVENIEKKIWKYT